MEQFAEQLSRLAELSDAELTSLEEQLVTAFDAADASGDIDLMQQLAEALDTVRAEIANKASAEAPVAEEVPEGVEPVAASGEVDETETTTDPGEGEGEGGEGEPEEGETEAEPETETETQPETDTADQEETVKVTSADVPAENAPVTASAAPTFTITAGGDVPGYTAGQVIEDMDGVVEALTSKANNLRGVTGEVRTVVASLKTDFDEDKMLRRSDPVGNSEKIRKIVRAGQEGGNQALVAAGWCAPKTPIYDHVNGMALGTTDTPVLDSLATVGVDRGGVVWQAPYGVAQIPTTSFGHWKAGQDGVWGWVQGINPAAPANGGADKPCLTIPCPPEVTAELGAIPLCICTEILMSRANPEFIRHFTDLTMIAHARFKEQWALSVMDAVAVTFTGQSGVPGTGAADTLGTLDVPLGAARDILLVWRVAAANFRWENRISPTTTLNVYAPSWLRDAMAADLTVQIPGDDTLSVSYAEVEGYIADLNLNPIWHIDDNPAAVPGAAANFDSPMGFGQSAVWYLSMPGSMVHLDGGSLDLGVTRSKQDIAQNRFCEFAETFDGLAYMGPAGSQWLLKGVTVIEVRGAFGPAVASVGAGGIIGEA